MSAHDPMPLALERLLLASVAFVALPHVFHLSPVIVLFFAAMVGWRYASGVRPELRPGRALLLAATLLGGILVYLQYHRFYGRDGGAALFLVSVGLKTLETRSRRDVYLVVYLAFFVALTQYLFSQSIPMALYTLVAVGLSISVLIGLNAGPGLALGAVFRRAGAMLAQSLPVMLVLFIFFPRIAGPLWKLPEEEHTASTGLSDTIEPGSISRLGQSSQPAFRIDFEGRPPPPAERYWRGPVFWHTDGQRWTLAAERELNPQFRPVFTGPAYRYTIILEPHRKKWVFALDLPDAVPGELAETAEYLLLAREPIAERRQYTLVSRPRFRTGPLSAAERTAGLRLPRDLPPRIRELVQSWQSAQPAPRALVNRALRYFREEPFVYTLNPPLLAGNPVETFLFDTRRGFCEHYATAFVVLMRVAGIPARVVTGYQGGVWNPVGHFLEVRQADAHAWAEVWLDPDGWTRVDPTAAVAPERIELGIDPDAPSAAGEVRFNPAVQALAQRALGLRDWMLEARQVWASIDHAWNLWVLGYGPENQKRFQEILGIVDWQGLALWLGGLLGLCGVAAGFLFWPKRKQDTDPAVMAYGRFLRKLERRGILKRTGEGPTDFARRAADAWPDAKTGIHGITAVFVRIRYGRGTKNGELARLRRLVRGFRV